MEIDIMGMFYMYSTLKGYDLYDLIDYKNAYIGWEQDNFEPYKDCQVVKEEIRMIKNIYDYIVCAEMLPNKIILYYGNNFQEKMEMSYDNGQNWLYIHGYNKIQNYILKECYACIDYAINAVEDFCKVVAHNKAEQHFLEGHTEYE